jgi:hypothetical protein
MLHLRCIEDTAKKGKRSTLKRLRNIEFPTHDVILHDPATVYQGPKTFSMIGIYYAEDASSASVYLHVTSHLSIRTLYDATQARLMLSVIYILSFSGCSVNHFVARREIVALGGIRWCLIYICTEKIGFVRLGVILCIL